MNPRPHKSHLSFYARVLSLNLVLQTAGRQAIGRTSSHELFRPSGRLLAGRTTLQSSPDPLSRCQRSGVAELSREGQFVVGFCVFSRVFYEANRGPRRATQASTYTSKPIAPIRKTRRRNQVDICCHTYTGELPPANEIAA